MKKIVPVDCKRLAEFESSNVYSIKFEVEGSILKRVLFDTSEGPFSLLIDSYSIKAVEPARRDVFRVVCIDTNSVFPDQIRDFRTEREREDFVSALQDNNNCVEIVLSNFKELDV